MFSSTGLIISTFLVVSTLCYNRYVRSVVKNEEIVGEDGIQGTPPVPYWLPWVGHGLSLSRDPERFVRHISVRSSHGIFSLRLFGWTWNIVTHGSLLDQILQQTNESLESTSAQWWFLCKVFGADRKYKQAFLNTHRDLRKPINLSEYYQPESPPLLNSIIQRVQSQVPNLVSFSEGPVDQNRWERNAHARLVHRGVVEVDLFALTRNFVGHTILPSLLGSEFLELYPGISDDLLDLDSSLKYLLLGLPRWFPLQSLAKANMARHRLDNAIDSFHKALDKAASGTTVEPPWHDMSDVSQEMNFRCAIWRKHKLPPAVKGPLDLQLLRITTININNLVFWLLIRVCSTPDLVDKVRAETASFAKAAQPVQDLGIPEPPSLELNAEALSTACPLLKACFYECLRLDTSAVAIRSVSKDTVITKPREDLFGTERPASYRLKAGEMVAVPIGMYQYDPHLFRFTPEKFLLGNERGTPQLKIDPQYQLTCDDGSNMILEHEEVQSAILSFVAGILALWDIVPVTQGRSVVPDHNTAPNFHSPIDDVRVQVRQRPLKKLS